MSSSWAGGEFTSRLIVGTGKYPTLAIMRRAHEASGAEIVTVAVRRRESRRDRSEESLLDYIDTSAILPAPEHRRLLHRRRRHAHLPAGARGRPVATG